MEGDWAQVLMKAEVEQRAKILSGLVSDIPDDLARLSGAELNFVVQDDATIGNVRITKDKAKILPPLFRPSEEASKEGYVSVPIIMVQSPEEAVSLNLKKEVFKHQICVIRNLNRHLGLDLSLFSTPSLRKKQPKATVEVRKQKLQPGDQCKDENGNVTWKFESQKDEWLLEQYADYQMKNDARLPPRKRLKLDHVDAEDENTIWFGTNVDLDKEDIWSEELKELEKLPAWLRPKSETNMLSGLKFPLQGMNTVQLYLKVRGSRTPAHQENNNFCSVNINVGPGVTEWFATPYSSWGLLNDLCKKRQLRFLSDAWWPDVETLRAHGCPLFRFSQQPGDVVFVNVGCVHWVQALSTCNNIAWNVGPMTVKQFVAASERYEWNKKEKFVSVVPMKRLSWNLAKNERNLRNPGLRKFVRLALAKSFLQYLRECNAAENANIETVNLPKPETEPSFLCIPCGEEVFGTIFGKVSEEEDEKVVSYCFRCAKKESPNLKGFTLFLEYDRVDLINLYDSLKV